MKRIRKLTDPTEGLSAYVEEFAGGAPSWEQFRDHAAGDSYRDLVETLVMLQHGLCGYCEVDLIETDRQVEHVVPRSDPDRGTSEALNCENLIASCVGGTAKYLHGPDAGGDEVRFLAPAKRNISCGQAKEVTIDAAFVDPRSLPALPALVKVSSNGTMDADHDACERCGLNTESVNRTIEILGLNVERLRNARRNHWDALNRWIDGIDGREALEANLESGARSELLPDENGRLPRFFTTSRSYFAPYGERILQQDTDKWI